MNLIIQIPLKNEINCLIGFSYFFLFADAVYICLNVEEIKHDVKKAINNFFFLQIKSDCWNDNLHDTEAFSRELNIIFSGTSEQTTIAK